MTKEPTPKNLYLMLKLHLVLVQREHQLLERLDVVG
jgi:hypothetical protein